MSWGKAGGLGLFILLLEVQIVQGLVKHCVMVNNFNAETKHGFAF